MQTGCEPKCQKPTFRHSEPPASLDREHAHAVPMSPSSWIVSFQGTHYRLDCFVQHLPSPVVVPVLLTGNWKCNRIGRGER